MKKRVYKKVFTGFLILWSLSLFSQEELKTSKLDDSSALSLINESKGYYDAKQYSKAAEGADKAYLFFKQNRVKLAVNFAEAAFQVGRTSQKLAKDSIAVIYFEEAIAIWKVIYPEGTLKEAEARFYVAKYNYKLRNFEEAIQVGLHALNLQRKFLAENHLDLISTLRFLANANKAFGETDKAIVFFDEALKISIFNYGEINQIVAGILNEKGSAYHSTGNYQMAIKFLEKALSIQQKILPINSKSIAGNCRIIGNCYAALRNADKALIYYFKELEIIITDTVNNAVPISYCYSNIGEAYLEKKNFKKAKVYFQSSHKILLEMGLADQPVYGYVCTNLGLSYFAMGEYNNAILFQQKSIDLLQGYLGNDNPNIGALYKRLATAQSAKGDFVDAINSYNKDIRILTTWQGPDFLNLYHSYFGKANTLKNWFKKSREQNHLEESLLYFEKAEKIILNQLKKDEFIDGQKKLLTDAIPIFENYISAELLNTSNLQIANSNIEKAWQLSESLHSYLLYSTVLESKARIFAGIPQSELVKDSLLQVEITNLEKAKHSLIERNGLSLIDSLILVKNILISERKDEQSKLHSQFEKLYPEYAHLKFNLSPSTILRTQQFLSNDQTLIEYFTGDSSIFTFVIQKNKSEVFELKKDFPLNEWTQQLKEGTTSYHTSKNKSSSLYASTVSQYAEVAYKIYSKLIAPIANILTSEIIIIPDEAIASISFESLLSEVPKDISNFKTYPFIVKKHIISYCYSATMLYQMMERKHMRHSSLGILACAPFFEDNLINLNSKLQNEFALRFGLSVLPYSGEEVKRIGNRFGISSKVLIGKLATKQKFQELANQYNIIHLATHGQANHQYGDFSFLAFSDYANINEKGFLSVGELYNLTLNADLVVLSACETAIGEQQRGEGVISMARAFAYAGAKSIVASLWKVNDKSTMQIMDNFYKELEKGNSKSLSLTLSKRNYLKTSPGQGSHPFFWAGFIPVGDMSCIKFD